LQDEKDLQVKNVNYKFNHPHLANCQDQQYVDNVALAYRKHSIGKYEIPSVSVHRQLSTVLKMYDELTNLYICK
jgi:hypothetical protein